MKITKLKNIISKSQIKPSLTQVQIKNNTMYATDSFQAVRIDLTDTELETDPENEVYLTASMIKNDITQIQADHIIADHMKIETNKTNDPYPDINTIIPNDETLEKDYKLIRVDYKYLKNIIEVFEEQNKGDKIPHFDIYINETGSQKPIIIKRRNVTALLAQKTL